MSNQSEKNQFRRLVGDYAKNEVTDNEIESYLDDATEEATSDFGMPVTDFDVLVKQYHPEVVYAAAINWWWDTAAKLQDRHSQTVGQASQGASEKWDRAIKMIELLRAQLDVIQLLEVDIIMGNNSRFSKDTLTRVGGVEEEKALGH